MSNNLFEQVIFGVYEILADIVPGFIILMTFIRYFNIALIESLPSSLNAITYIFFAFLIGQIIHCIASEIEGYINKWKYGGYPSALYLTEDDDTFPPYFKAKIRQQMKRDYGTPEDSSSQHIFEICYTYVVQNNISNRVLIFLNMYTFSRNMMLISVIEGVLFFIWAFINNDRLVGLLSIPVMLTSFFFYRRFIRYAESFAKEVFRSYFVEKVENSRTL